MQFDYFDYIVGNYLCRKNEAKLLARFSSENLARSYAEWKAFDSFGGIFFVWDTANDTIIFYSSTAYENDRWLHYDKATIYNATLDADERLIDKFEKSELLNLIRSAI